MNRGPLLDAIATVVGRFSREEPLLVSQEVYGDIKADERFSGKMHLFRVDRVEGHVD